MPHEEWYRRFKSACRIGKYSKISSCVPARPSVCVPSHTSYEAPFPVPEWSHTNVEGAELSKRWTFCRSKKRSVSFARRTFCSSIFIKSGLPVRKLRATSSATRMLLFSRLQFITELYPCKDVTGYNRGSMTNCTRGRMSHSPCSLIP